MEKLLQKSRLVNDSGIIKNQVFNSKAILKANKGKSLEYGWVTVNVPDCKPSCRGVLPNGDIEVCQNGSCIIIPNP